MFRKTKRKRKIQVERNRKKIKAGRFFFYLICLIFLGTLVYAFFFSLLLKINSVEVIGNRDIGEELILEKIKNLLEKI